ncbi:uncharacterized protein LOC122279861 [Carya illinoinensis]|uniref:Uncharacterized protein n=1 Tax=Carya illinoinensis TaxID=32201 RepID=A0A922J323_CARIL|nr:uncharacterized protein LOC122279861 [Carya illinoinensis]KAG6692525.1 hypothetical protein I3842_10G118800 [Carya illinoinensis]KAG6692526.1 hypothetical protein I3842_10G118800 [Carya illinoinensis]
MMSEPALERTDNNGITALHETTFRGNYKMAKCLIRKNRRLVHISSPGFTELPVVMAMMFGHKELAHYLYELIVLQDLEVEQGDQGSALLTYAIYARELEQTRQNQRETSTEYRFNLHRRMHNSVYCRFTHQEESRANCCRLMSSDQSYRRKRKRLARELMFIAALGKIFPASS